MSQDTSDHLTMPARTAAEEPPRDAASVVFNLTGCTVTEAVALPRGGRRVVVTNDAREGACPSCGVFSTRVHQRVR